MQSLLTRWVWPCGWAQSVNNYEKEVYNGDPGYITSVDPQARSVTVQYPCSSAGEPWPPPLSPTAAVLLQAALFAFPRKLACDVAPRDVSFEDIDTGSRMSAEM